MVRFDKQTLKYEILELAKHIQADITEEDLMFMNTLTSLVEMYMELCYDSNLEPIPEIANLQKRLRKMHRLIEEFEEK